MSPLWTMHGRTKCEDRARILKSEFAIEHLIDIIGALECLFVCLSAYKGQRPCINFGDISFHLGCCFGMLTLN